LHWPCGDSTYPPAIKHNDPDSGGIELLGSSVWGSPTSFLSSQIDKMFSVQDKLALLKDSPVELHLLGSCLSICKITHLL